MFGNNNRSKQDRGPTLVGEGATIVGSMTVKGRVQVDGVVEGSLEVEGHVSIGPQGRVRGDLIADDVAIGGEVEGRVHARQHLHMVSTGKVKGDVNYDTLQVDRGAIIDGRTLHGEPDVPANSDAPVALRPSQAPGRAAAG